MLNNCCITWKSTKQKTVALSSTESEYIALATCSKEAIWIDVRHHFIRDNVTNGTIRIKYMKSDELPPDFLTENVNQIKHLKFLNFINLRGYVENKS